MPRNQENAFQIKYLANTALVGGISDLYSSDLIIYIIENFKTETIEIVSLSI